MTDTFLALFDGYHAYRLCRSIEKPFKPSLLNRTTVMECRLQNLLMSPFLLVNASAHLFVTFTITSANWAMLRQKQSSSTWDAACKANQKTALIDSTCRTFCRFSSHTIFGSIDALHLQTSSLLQINDDCSDRPSSTNSHLTSFVLTRDRQPDIRAPAMFRTCNGS